MEKYILSVFRTKDVPCEGSSFITPDGRFVDLREQGHDHARLSKVMQEQGYNDNENFTALRRKRYIRCNDGTDNGYPYLELYSTPPTEKQYGALRKWLSFLFHKRKDVTMIVDDGNSFIDYSYENVAVENIIKDIERIYAVLNRGTLSVTAQRTDLT